MVKHVSGTVAVECRLVYDIYTGEYVPLIPVGRYMIDDGAGLAPTRFTADEHSHEFSGMNLTIRRGGPCAFRG